MGTWGFDPWQNDGIHDSFGNHVLFEFLEKQIDAVKISEDDDFYCYKNGILRALLHTSNYCGQYMDSFYRDVLLLKLYPKYKIAKRLMDKEFSIGYMKQGYHDRVEQEYEELIQNVKVADDDVKEKIGFKGL